MRRGAAAAAVPRCLRFAFSPPDRRLAGPATSLLPPFTAPQHRDRHPLQGRRGAGAPLHSPCAACCMPPCSSCRTACRCRQLAALPHAAACLAFIFLATGGGEAADQQDAGGPLQPPHLPCGPARGARPLAASLLAAGCWLLPLAAGGGCCCWLLALVFGAAVRGCCFMEGVLLVMMEQQAMAGCCEGSPGQQAR